MVRRRKSIRSSLRKIKPAQKPIALFNKSKRCQHLDFRHSKILRPESPQSSILFFSNCLLILRLWPSRIPMPASSQTGSATSFTPLQNNRYGAAGGYRWFVPKKNNLASVGSLFNQRQSCPASCHSIFNQAWGGSMAIRADTFRKIGLDKIWQTAASDDLSLTCAVKKSGMRLAFVPACLVASYESCTFSQLFEFARRQFIITRVYKPSIWSFALFGTLYSILGFWGGLALAIYAYSISAGHLALYAAVPIVFLASQILRAILRQSMISKLLKDDWPKLKRAAAADILASGLWTILMFFFIVSSAFGRTIVWRGIKYPLNQPTDTVILSQDK